MMKPGKNQSRSLIPTHEALLEPLLHAHGLHNGFCFEGRVLVGA